MESNFGVNAFPPPTPFLAPLVATCFYTPPAAATLREQLQQMPSVRRQNTRTEQSKLYRVFTRKSSARESFSLTQVSTNAYLHPGLQKKSCVLPFTPPHRFQSARVTAKVGAVKMKTPKLNRELIKLYPAAGNAFKL